MIINADFDVIFKKPIKNEYSDPSFDELWGFLIPDKVYHIVGIDDETGGYVLKFFDPEILFEKQAFEEVLPLAD